MKSLGDGRWQVDISGTKYIYCADNYKEALNIAWQIKDEVMRDAKSDSN